MDILRLLLEMVGTAGFAVLQFLLVLVYELGAGLRGVNSSVLWYTVAFGYGALTVTILAARHLFVLSSPRLLLDTWLLAFYSACVVTFGLVVFQWPLSSSSGGHGLSSGGEANSAALPILHVLLWVLIDRLLARRRVAAGS